jgi:hypothetical protein
VTLAALAVALGLAAAALGFVLARGERAETASGAAGATGAPAAWFLAPWGKDANPCTRTAPCRSLQRAFALARPGEVVELADGRYRGGRLAGAKPAPGVTFAGSRRARIATDLTLAAANVAFAGLTIDVWRTTPAARGITFRNVEHGWFGLRSADDVRLLGGEVDGGGQATGDPQITEFPGSRDPPTNILVDGVLFHDWIDAAGGRETTHHIECLQIGAGVNVTIRNSTFRNCSVHDIFVRSWGGTNGSVHPLRNVVIENNVLEETRVGYYAIQFKGDLNPAGCAGNVIRGNRLGQGVHTAACGVTVTGNTSLR